METRTAKRLDEYKFDMLPEGAWITGADTRDSKGNIYFLMFDFRGYCAIIKINLASQ